MTNTEIQTRIIDHLQNDILSANDENRVVTMVKIYEIFKDDPNVDREDIGNAIASWEGVTTVNEPLESRISIPKTYFKS